MSLQTPDETEPLSIEDIQARLNSTGEPLRGNFGYYREITSILATIYTRGSDYFINLFGGRS